MVKSTYCGNVTVADDIVLLSTRVKGLQELISKMENYSKEWRFEFNTRKSSVVVFGETTRLRNVLKDSRGWFLDGKPIREESTVEHACWNSSFWKFFFCCSYNGGCRKRKGSCFVVDECRR